MFRRGKWGERKRRESGALVSALTAVFEVVYARPPGNWPRLSPEMEEMLTIDPPSLALHMCKLTYLETNHVPVRVESDRGITSNAGIVNQCVDPPKRVPSPLNGRLNGRTIRANVELNGHCSQRRTGARLAGADSIDLVAERLEAVDTARGGDDSAAGLGQVEADLSADPRRRSGHHSHLAAHLELLRSRGESTGTEKAPVLLESAPVCSLKTWPKWTLVELPNQPKACRYEFRQGPCLLLHPEENRIVRC
nr:hypothetical protein Iba_chr10dCG4020 [Ipomoea batatas]